MVNTPRPSRGTRIESCDFIVLIGDPVKKKGSVAFSLSTLRNMMCCVRFQGT